MAYSVRYQVFLSSTYTDLVEERAEVLQAIWELDCIPTGMEAFVASNEAQWDVIKRVIDECDYYVLLIGGRYGTTTDEGISYTEKEYNYAKQRGLPVLAFVHADPEQIPSGKTEKDVAARQRLDAFRSRVMSEHPVRRWSNPQELGGAVSRSLSRETKINPRPGWVRNDGSSPVELLEQVNRLTQENQELRASISASASDADLAHVEGLEAGDDKVELEGSWQIYHTKEFAWYNSAWSVTVSWDEIFRVIGPALINETTESNIQSILATFHGHADLASEYGQVRRVAIDMESFNEVIVQFRALGLIDKGRKKRGVNDRASYWAITDRGDRHLVHLLARRKVRAAEPA